MKIVLISRCYTEVHQPRRNAENVQAFGVINTKCCVTKKPINDSLCKVKLADEVQDIELRAHVIGSTRFALKAIK